MPESFFGPETSGVLLAGVDEAGRGPLAGPVLAAAVILDPSRPIESLCDSKLLSPAQREEVAGAVRGAALAWSIGRAEVEEIESLNILQATLLAMRRAVLGLALRPSSVLVDGNRCPTLPCRVEAVVGGDRVVSAISAASVLAKTARDAEMVELDARFPQYGFARHKGYATALHVERLKRHGVCPVHRRTFKPVRDLLESRQSL